MVWTLDRRSRSLEDRLRRLARIEASDARFHSLAERIDTTTPARDAGDMASVATDSGGNSR